MLFFCIFAVNTTHMKKLIIACLYCIIHGVSADEFVLNESALRMNARDMALGGLISTFEAPSSQSLEFTYLMPFQLKELSIRKLEFHQTAFGLDGTCGWYQSGNMDWMENDLVVHVGKKLSEQLYLGIDLDVLLVDNVVDNASTTCFTGVDCHYQLTEKMTIGLTLINPGGAYIRSGNTKIPLSSSAYLGTRITPCKTCKIYGEMGMNIDNQLIGRLGLEYLLTEALTLRTGFSCNPMMPSWGLGGRIHHFRYSWGGNLHPILGLSNGFTLNYYW
jgi:hypothetical protein